MRVAMKIKLASPKSAPQQARRCERHYDERYDGLPVHGTNIDWRACLGNVFIQHCAIINEDAHSLNPTQ